VQRGVNPAADRIRTIARRRNTTEKPAPSERGARRSRPRDLHGVRRDWRRSPRVRPARATTRVH